MWSNSDKIASIAQVAIAVGTLAALLGLRTTRREVGILERQLDLQSREFKMARKVAFPHLGVETGASGGLYVPVTVKWLHGTDPAYEVEIWIRRNEGYRHAWIEDIAPRDDVRSIAIPATKDEMANCPFPGFEKEVPDVKWEWVGMCWFGPDGTSASLSEKRFYAIHEADGQGGCTVLPGQLPVPGAKAINRAHPTTWEP